MKKNTTYEGLHNIPNYILVDLIDYLKDNEVYFKKQLIITGIMIEKDNYQISLKTIDDLDNLIHELNNNGFKQRSCA